jgi:hypothetical protein
MRRSVDAPVRAALSPPVPIARIVRIACPARRIRDVHVAPR